MSLSWSVVDIYIKTQRMDNSESSPALESAKCVCHLVSWLALVYSTQVGLDRQRHGDIDRACV